jgi:[NiFe] hydrogenase assembly HybE family chaperone
MTTDEAAGEATARELLKLEQRVGVLYRRFQVIAEGMKDLPLYNPAIAVEPVDFQLLGERGIGVLVTPWFMNVLLLPLEHQPFRMSAVGARSERELPAGPRPFVVGGDEQVGLYESHSLYSPLADFATHEAAVERARATLCELMTPPSKPAAEAQATTVYRQADGRTDGARARRDFLFGRRST